MEEKKGRMVVITSYQFLKFRINAMGWGVVIGFIAGVVLGYAWRVIQIEPLEDRIVRLQKSHQYYSDQFTGGKRK